MNYLKCLITKLNNKKILHPTGIIKFYNKLHWFDASMFHWKDSYEYDDRICISSNKRQSGVTTSIIMIGLYDLIFDKTSVLFFKSCYSNHYMFKYIIDILKSIEHEYNIKLIETVNVSEYRITLTNNNRVEVFQSPDKFNEKIRGRRFEHGLSIIIDGYFETGFDKYYNSIKNVMMCCGCEYKLKIITGN